MSDSYTKILSSPENPSPVGKQIVHYAILAPLGKGGMGEVYLAEDTRLRRKVAIKFLPAQFTASEIRLRRFIQEARTVSALNHPNIVTIYDIGEAEAGRFIVMEYIEGRTLRVLLKEAPPIPTVVKLVSQVAEALANAHAAGVIHRDIKPENIMVRTDQYLKVLDFGLARLAPRNLDQTSSDPSLVTEQGMVVGTMTYMSPEQARGESVTAATDIFALGIVLFELLTRRHPFQGDSLLAILHAIATEQPVPPSQLNRDISPGLESLVLRMLEKDARLRPTAADVFASLQALAEPSVAALPPVVISSPCRAVGREKEKLAIHQALATVASGRSGRGLLFCISGEAGIGKTTLVEAFLADLQETRQPFNIARGRCSERLAGSEAYLPILEALGNLMAESSGYLTRLLRALAPTWYAQVATLSPDDPSDARVMADIKMASQERLKRELSAFLQESTRDKPLVLFIDNLHWADHSTIDLLTFLGDRFDSLRVLILATYRPSDVSLSKHPFLPVKLEMQGRGLCRELALGFLSKEEVDLYLAQEFPEHRFPSDLTRLIHKKTEGSPLFMTDLVRFLRDQEVIAEQHGHWELVRNLPDISDGLPQSVRSMIQKKIDQLDEGDRQLLVAASVQGYEFDSAVIAKVLGRDPAEVEERLEILEQVYAFIHLLAETELPDGSLTLRCRFIHSLYQNALYSSLKPTRRISLNAAVAKALLEFHQDQAAKLASELAFLFEAARDHARAADYFLLASRHAARRFANHEAVRLARRGLQALDSTVCDRQRDQRELALQLAVVMPLVALTGYSSADVGKTLLRVRELCEQLGDTRFLFSALYGLYWVYNSCGDDEKAWQQIEAMFGLAEKHQDSGQLMQAHYIKGAKLYALGRLTLAREQLEKAVALHDPNLHAAQGFIYGIDPGLYGRSTLARCLGLLGYPVQSGERFQEALTLAQTSSHSVSKCLVMLDASRIYISRRDLAGLRRLGEEIVTISTAHENGLLPWGTLLHGYATVFEGQKEAGLSQMRTSFAAIEKLNIKTTLPAGMFLLAEALKETGDMAEGLALLDAALVIAEEVREFVAVPEVYRLKGALLMEKAAKVDREGATGDEVSLLRADAEACFQKAIELARGQDAKMVELRAAMSLSRLYHQQQDPGRARQILFEIYSWFSEGLDTEELQDAAALLEDLSGVGDVSNGEAR